MIRGLLTPGDTAAAANDEPLSDEDLEALYAPPASGRHVRADLVATLDGAVEFKGSAASLEGGDDDLRVFTTLRALADVVVVGASTQRVEDYGPARLSSERARRRRERGEGGPPAIAVITNTASISPASKLFASSGANRPIVVTSQAAPADRRRALDDVAEVVVAGDERVELGAALDALAERGLRRQLCEGGPMLFSSLLHEGLFDDLCLTVRSALAGPGHLSLTRGEAFAEMVRLEIVHLLVGDGVLLGRYRADGR